MQGLRYHFKSTLGKSPEKLEVTSRHDHSLLMGRKASNQTNKTDVFKLRSSLKISEIFSSKRLQQLNNHVSSIMRKPTFCICKNKDADQLRGNREADQPLCFRYTDSTIPLLSKSEISSV